MIEPTPGSQIGLNWFPAGVDFGAGADPGGGPAPYQFAGDYSYMGNSNFGLDLTGGAPLTTYGFYWSLGSLCPAIQVAGLPPQLAPPIQLRAWSSPMPSATRPWPSRCHR